MSKLKTLNTQQAASLVQQQQANTSQVEAIKRANALQANPAEIKVVSFDSKTGTKNFINEVPNATDFGFEIKNTTDRSIFVLIAAGLAAWKEDFLDFFPGTFMDGDDLLDRVGADCALGDGKLVDDGSGKTVTAKTMNSRRKLSELTRYAAKTPIRFTSFTMSSFKASTGEAESSNYNNSIKSLWLSPFEDTVETEFSLRSVVKDRFIKENLTVNFLRDAPMLKSIISDEHVMVLQVNADTVLNIRAHIGARMSSAQQFYRIVKEADKLVRPLIP